MKVQNKSKNRTYKKNNSRIRMNSFVVSSSFHDLLLIPFLSSIEPFSFLASHPFKSPNLGLHSVLFACLSYSKSPKNHLYRFGLINFLLFFAQRSIFIITLSGCEIFAVALNDCEIDKGVSNYTAKSSRG